MWQNKLKTNKTEAENTPQSENSFNARKFCFKAKKTEKKKYLMNKVRSCVKSKSCECQYRHYLTTWGSRWWESIFGLKMTKKWISLLHGVSKLGSEGCNSFDSSAEASLTEWQRKVTVYSGTDDLQINCSEGKAEEHALTSQVIP